MVGEWFWAYGKAQCGRSGRRLSETWRGATGGWGPLQLRAALEYCREWNTNSRVCHGAQALLAAILRRHSPQVPPRRLAWRECSVPLHLVCRAAVLCPVKNR